MGIVRILMYFLVAVACCACAAPAKDHNGEVNHRPLVGYYVSNVLAAAPIAIQDCPSPTTDACASGDYLCLDLELESSACYFWYKVNLIKAAWRSGCPGKTRCRILAHEPCKD